MSGYCETLRSSHAHVYRTTVDRLQGTSALEVEFAKEICESVLQQLHTTWQLTPRDLGLVAATIQVEPEVVAEIHKQMRASQKRARKKKKRQQEEEATAIVGDLHVPKNADALTPSQEDNSAAPESMEHYFELYEASVDSYRSAFCQCAGSLVMEKMMD